MRLKSLKLAGFKSFANPTTLTFKHGITAIVGPNGCGKSNVIDAIRWVLGETSAKQLRGGAMSDVIFAGTDGKAGKSLASVELTFEHTQDETTGIRHPLNVYHELTLRRQITIEGKSDYFINGQKVRRRDVVDVFLGTGLGARSYAVIEQGMIGRIIDADGQKLREFIEEAAGVSRYQARREETEKQLTKASDNLERLSDLHSELQKQHKSLARQAKSAQVYEALQHKLHNVEQAILTRRLYDTWLAHAQAKKQQQTLGNELHALNDTMAQLAVDWQTLASELAQMQWQKEEALSHFHHATLAHQAATHATTQVKQQIEQTQETLRTLAYDDTHHADTHQKYQSELELHQASIATLAPQLHHIDEQCHALNSQAQTLKAVYQDNHDALQDLYHNRQSQQNHLNLTQASIKRVSALLEKSVQKQHALNQEQAALVKMTPDNDTNAIKQLLTTKQAQLATLEEDLEADKREQTALIKDLQHAQSTLTAHEKNHSRLSSEYDTLHKLVYPPKTHQQDTPKTAMTLATLQETLTLSPLGKSYVATLDQFLAVLLSDGIADKQANEHELLAQLLSSDGKVGVWRTNSNTNTNTNTNTNENKMADKFVPLSALIVSPRLALWECVSVFDDSQGDVPDWHDLPTKLVLTTSGWLVSAVGAIPCQKLTQGAKGDFLRQRQSHLDRLATLEAELTALEEMLEQQTTHHKKLKAKHDALSLSIDERTAQIRTLTYECGRLATDYTKAESELLAYQKDSHRLDVAKKALAQDKAELELELATLKNSEQSHQEQLAMLLPQIDIAKAKQNELNAKQSALDDARKDQADKRHKLILERQRCEQAIAHLHAQLKHESEQHAKRLAQKNALSATLDSLNKKLPKLIAEETQAHQAVSRHQADSERYEQAFKDHQDKQTALQQHRADKQARIDDINARLASVGAEVAVALARVQDLGEQLGERVAEFNLGAKLADFDHPNFDVQTVLGSDMDELVGEQKRLASEIGKLGAVNLGAKAELDELESRLNPMQKEIDDVKASIDTLKNAIDTINQKTKGLFLAMLQSVNEELNALFAKVFGGGQASLTLMDDDTLAKADKWRAGLVLMAQPKGKKNSRLAVLSGGEKTLTALSLIFAIFKQNPAPFCVLDEVDAPLDDANVGRFTHLIGELSSSVQFIFISHNKLAMQTAHELKGVTMPTAGISSLVTVSLEDAQKYLEPTA